MRRSLPSVAPALLAVICIARQGQATPEAEGVEFFEKQVRPVLIQRCYECHSAEKNKVKGGLALDSKLATLTGGDSGPGLVPGEPDKSKIIEAIRYKNQDLQMPPKSPLPAAELKALEDWVRMGAPDPRDGASTPAAAKGRVIDIAAGRKFWSFQPLSEVSVPQIAGVNHPIDAFLQKARAEKKLDAAPPADKRTLIRRATFDLTGLPPTPEETDAFLHDDSAQAFERVIERLLASPQYGERWGRHWLDVARYADSNGLDENLTMGHAWRYRDYVVRAFNEDKPFDRFLIEQIAGDLLPDADESTRLDNLTGTGFLALGAKVLAEPDREKLTMDVIDEQLDTIGKAFLGMTFGCVRCHDHKFDPVTQGDYYSLAAIFRGTKSLGDERTGAIKHWYEHSLATAAQIEAKKEHEKTVKAKTAELTGYAKEARASLKTELQSRAADYLAAAAALSMQADYSEVERLAKQHGLRPRYLLTCRQYLEKHQEHPVFAKWHELVRAKHGSEVRGHYSSLFAKTVASQKAAAEKITEAKAKSAAKPADPTLAAAWDALNDIAGFLAIPDKDADAFDAATFTRVMQMKDDLMRLEDETPDPPAIMGVTEGDVTRTLPIHIRGSHLTLGNAVPRGFPEVMQVSLTKPILPGKQSGRLELARWMASAEHPLTARVFVNRAWRWHFGKGIVTTTDNFGTLGDRPSHPELLDWLARHFIECGWHVKDLHRLIMTSAAYQQASSIPHSELPDPHLTDPENRLLWRFNLQRLEAEQIRDALLFVSGGLSGEIGGKTIPLRNKEFVFNHTSKDQTKYESPRRALYLPIIRNHLYDMLEQFDYPDPTMPTGSRNSTTVAPQALILMNAPVAMQSGERLATRLIRDTGTQEPRPLIERAHLLLYNRPPTEHEIQRAETFLKNSGQDFNAALTLLCQTLLAANEFVFVR